MQNLYTSTISDAQKAFINDIMDRAATNSAFRQALLDRPSDVLREEGLDVPDNVTVRFVENHGADLTLVLPDPVAPEAELSDAALETVAGGTATTQSWPSWWKSTFNLEAGSGNCPDGSS